MGVALAQRSYHRRSRVTRMQRSGALTVLRQQTIEKHLPLSPKLNTHTQIGQFVNQHPRTRTITNHEMRNGVTIPILPGAISQYKEYHPWSDYIPNHDYWDMADQQGNRSSEHYMSSLFYQYAQKTPMSTLIIVVPTSDSAHRMSFDMMYHYQDAVRAADLESLTAQFARPGRPMNNSTFNTVMTHAGSIGIVTPLRIS